MAKELPYFRFTAFQWLNDDISMESYELKGLFIDICAWYWFKDCSIDLATLNKRFKDAIKQVNELIELGILKTESTDFIVRIDFLDEQYDLLSEKRQKYVEAGRIGGLKRSSNAKATLKQRSSYKDNDNDKYNDKEIDLNYYFDSENFKNSWNDWKSYKLSEHKFKYKAVKTEQAALTELYNLSSKNENTAIKIINKSITNGWKGLFSLKTDNKEDYSRPQLPKL